jgi:hypothetical protein
LPLWETLNEQLDDVISRGASVEALLPEHWTLRWVAKDLNGYWTVTDPIECAREIASARPRFYSANGRCFIHGSGKC